MKNWLPKCSQWLWVWGVYIVLTLIVIAPLLRRGFILVLDMVFTPQLRMPAIIDNTYPLQVLLHGLNLILPGDIIQKILLFVILFLSGVGMHRLIVKLASSRNDRHYSFGGYFAGTLYMINPFTYDRFMAGQYGVLLGYALLPWFMQSLLIFFRKPTARNAIIVAAWMIGIGVVSLHTIGMAVLLASVGTILALLRWRVKPGYAYRLLSFGLLATIIYLVASSYWIVPLTLGQGSTAAAIGSFGLNDQQAFSTLGGDVVGRIANIVRLQGFWIEGQGMYILPQDQIHHWGLLAVIIWTLVIAGGISWWRSGRRLEVMLFIGSTVTAIVLATGELSGWLAAHVRFFAGYREPDKFVALVALSYAIFAARGISAALDYCAQQSKILSIAAVPIALCIPIVWTRTMLWGFSGQLAPVRYPADWYTINVQLDRDHSNFQVLFLPWHLYMTYEFANERIIASPAPKFFDKPMIVSNDPEFNGASAVPNVKVSSIDHILRSANGDLHLGAKLARYHIKYVLLANEDDYSSYDYLNHQADLRLISQGPTLELYRNEVW